MVNKYWLVVNKWLVHGLWLVMVNEWTIIYLMANLTLASFLWLMDSDGG